MLKRLMSGLVFFASIGLMSGLAIGLSSPALADEPGSSEIHVSLDEAHHVWIVPSIAATRMTLDYGGTSSDPGPHGASGALLGVQMIASSNRTRSLLVGLDLRQLLAETDGYRGANILGTKLGVRVEWRPEIRFRPGIGAAYFFWRHDRCARSRSPIQRTNRIFVHRHGYRICSLVRRRHEWHVCRRPRFCSARSCSGQRHDELPFGGTRRFVPDLCALANLAAHESTTAKSGHTLLADVQTGVPV